MSFKFYDVVVPKKYETEKNGGTVERTGWNRVGMAWKSRTSDSIIFELFLIPGHKYIISFKERGSPDAGQDESF